MKNKKYHIEPIKTVTVKDEKNMLFAVMRLNDKVEVTDAFGKKFDVSLITDENAGYIPVFKTIESAQHWACDGKYQIIGIEPIKDNTTNQNPTT